MTHTDLIKKYIDMATHNLLCYSNDYMVSKPKEGYEKEWAEANEEIEMLAYIGRLLEKHKNAPVGETQERMKELVNSILSHATTVCVELIDGNMVQAKIIDNVERKPLAVLNFEKIFSYYLLKCYQLQDKKETALGGQLVLEKQVKSLDLKDMECIARYIQAYVRIVFHEEKDVPIPCELCPRVTDNNCQPWTPFELLSKITGIKLSPWKGSMSAE